MTDTTARARLIRLLKQLAQTARIKHNRSVWPLHCCSRPLKKNLVQQEMP